MYLYGYKRAEPNKRLLKHSILYVYIIILDVE